MKKEITKLERDMYEAMIRETDREKCASLAAEVAIKYHEREVKKLNLLDASKLYCECSFVMIRRDQKTQKAYCFQCRGEVQE